MHDINAAAAAHRQANPPPAWWPIPPRGVAQLADLFPLVGDHDRQADETEADGDIDGRHYRFTEADILASTYPGDTVSSVARRLGMNRRSLTERRASSMRLTERMDARRGLS